MRAPKGKKRRGPVPGQRPPASRARHPQCHNRPSGGVLHTYMQAAPVADPPVNRGYPLPPPEPVDVFAQDPRPNIEEQDLLRRLNQGDELAFARLYELHWDGVARLLTRLLGDPDEAGDAAQEVFVQLFRKPPAPVTDDLGETQTGGTPLRAWLFR